MQQISTTPEGVRAGTLNPQAMPLVLTPVQPGLALGPWVEQNRAWIDGTLTATGAILFRGFGMADPVADFERVSRQLTGDLLDYVYRSTPRTAVASSVYSATEYPAKSTIPQHNENAYCRDWPMKLLFICTQPAMLRGETPLCVTAAVTRRISEATRAAFREKGVLYVRNYHEMVDLPWSVVFQTESKAEAEQFCREHDIQFEWQAGGSLKTWQRCQAFAVHPVTGEELWFNQAHLFHASSLDKANYQALRALYTEDQFPRNTYFGDGTPIPAEMLDEIRAAFAAETIAFPWQRNDVLLVDNMQVGHGRNPFSGPRKVLVCMGQPYSAFGQRAVFPDFEAKLDAAA
ncbi:TauD/TfdA family dioxygenase [Massilia endophytica]|uniref:TauD/TfdA family dioxygenase n=1 Tax=Massilia endophytica TaxID=2899220 RepID=UPI001E6079F3|nr:TauD/TfdA family dioxygenase [Massilia endophytica]UGQ48162.1 TauD/TfdA family dioxygenase [Massilia endophytica]